VGCFPSGVISTLVDPTWTLPAVNCTAFPADLGPNWSLFALICPYLEQQNLNNAVNFNIPIPDPSNQTVRETHTISAVLHGNRKLTKSQVIKLAAFFHVAPAAFLPRRPSRDQSKSPAVTRDPSGVSNRQIAATSHA
jgi:hypothetical protein